MLLSTPLISITRDVTVSDNACSRFESQMRIVLHIALLDRFRSFVFTSAWIWLNCSLAVYRACIGLLVEATPGSLATLEYFILRRCSNYPVRSQDVVLDKFDLVVSALLT